MSSEDLRVLYSSDRCRDDPELLVMVWSELAFRNRFADETAATFNVRPPEAKPAKE